jgi:hypothetical protein
VDRFWGLDHGVDIGRLAQLGQLKLTKAAYAYHNPRLSDRLLVEGNFVSMMAGFGAFSSYYYYFPVWGGDVLRSPKGRPPGR